MFDVNAVKAQAPSLLQLAEAFAPLKKVATIQGGEYSGPCPFCGGTDRFSVQPDHPIEPRWLCRVCTDGKWKDVITFIEKRDNIGFKDACQVLFGDNVKIAISPEELEKLQLERFERSKKIREEELKSEREVQNRLDASNAWEPFYNQLKSNPGAIELWKQQGLTEEWVDYYKVGYCAERNFGSFSSPTITIPYWQEEKCVGLTHRILIDDPPGGKYRPHLSGAGKVLFRADIFTSKVLNNVLIVEGEKKAMVTYSKIWRSQPTTPHPLYNYSVIGIPGKQFKDEWISEFDLAKNIWIALDPDATGQAEKLADRLGKDRCFIVELPDKIDDLFLINALDKEMLWEYLKGARK